MSPLHLFFAWPDGGVWSNIVASVLWTTPSFIIGFIIGHRKMIKHTNKHHDELLLHILKIKKHIIKE